MPAILTVSDGRKAKLTGDTWESSNQQLQNELQGYLKTSPFLPGLEEANAAHCRYLFQANNPSIETDLIITNPDKREYRYIR